MPIFALGLGELQTNSALNQPFEAELELFATPSELEDLEVKLASQDDFDRAGIERLPVLNALRFRVTRQDGRNIVLITSRQSIPEPYLNFLVEVNWSRGRLLREFTVLLDPPELLGGEAAPVQAPRAGDTTDSVTAIPVPAPTPSTPSAPADSRSPSGAIVYGPIEKNEKLWNIATELQGEAPQATVPQVMMALLRNNPEAFIDANVNRVKAGYILRIEDPADIYSMTPQEARERFSNQYQLWLDYKQQRALAAERRKRERELADYRTRMDQDMDTTATGEGTLTLVRPEGEKSVGGHLDSAEQGSGEESEEIQNLRRQLSDAEDSAAIARRENEAMHERLKSMEDQLAALQQLMEVRSDELTALQQELDIEQVEGGLDASDGSEMQGGGWQDTLIAKFKSMLKSLQDNPQTTGIVGGALFLFLTALWLIMRRRKESDLGNYRFAQAPVDSFNYKDQWTDTDELPQEQVNEWISQPQPASSRRQEMEEDPVTQADIFIAYGNLNAAIDVMQEATRKSPDNAEYHRKLDELKARRGSDSSAVMLDEPDSTDSSASATPEIDLSDENDLLTDDDLLDFEKEMAQTPEQKSADDDIDSAMADFGLDVGEDDDLGTGTKTGNDSSDQGLDFDLSDIHGELEQLTTDEADSSSISANESIEDFDLNELADELEQIKDTEIDADEAQPSSSDEMNEPD
ncbi:MAG: hypothetical protein HUJ29_07740, partial [Gammaproteobacteria bacterium]|nr:hypothetical protein [Gammaproteobacteria bacterium]